MRVLLDQNLPQRLTVHLSGPEVYTAAYQGWAGLSNGDLLTAAEEEAFDILITADQGLNYQQNLAGRKISLVVLSTNKNSLVMAGMSKLQAAIDVAAPGTFRLVDIGSVAEQVRALRMDAVKMEECTASCSTTARFATPPNDFFLPARPAW